MTWEIAVPALVLGALGAAAGLQAGLDARTRRSYPPPGRMIDVGGWRLHLWSKGEGVPVVLHAGFGGSCLDWTPLLDAPPDGVQLWAWDRPGMAWSDLGPRDADDPLTLMAHLHKALRTAGVDEPAVHVGHSLGGVHALAFARQHPEAVAGVVLVDSAHPELLERLPREDARKQFAQAQMLRWARYLTLFGAGRLLRFPVANMGKQAGALGRMARQLGYQTKSYFGVYSEVRGLLSADPRSVMGSLNSRPLRVLSTVRDGTRMPS